MRGWSSEHGDARHVFLRSKLQFEDGRLKFFRDCAERLLDLLFFPLRGIVLEHGTCDERRSSIFVFEVRERVCGRLVDERV